MRRFWFSTLVFMIAVSLVAPPLASGQESVLDKVKNRGRLVCGVYGGLPGFSFLSQDGTWSGFRRGLLSGNCCRYSRRSG